MLARGIPLPPMTRFLRESSRLVSSCIRTVASFMLRMWSFACRSRTDLGVMPVAPVVCTAEARFRPRVERDRADPVAAVGRPSVRSTVEAEREIPGVGVELSGLTTDGLRTRAAALVADAPEVDPDAEGAGDGDASARALAGAGLASPNAGGVEDAVEAGEPERRGVANEEAPALEVGEAERVLSRPAEGAAAEVGAVASRRAAAASDWVLRTATSSCRSRSIVRMQRTWSAWGSLVCHG